MAASNISWEETGECLGGTQEHYRLLADFPAFCQRGNQRKERCKLTKARVSKTAGMNALSHPVRVD